MTPQRVTRTTPGGADLAQSRAFHAALDWTRALAQDKVALDQMNGIVLGLFDKADLTADQGRPGTSPGTGAIAPAQNFPTEPEVDPVNPLWPLGTDSSLTLPAEP